MKTVFLWITCLIILCAGSFGLGRLWKQHRQIAAEAANLDNGFRPSEFPMQKRSFAVVISGYNNGALIEKTLRSVLSQIYEPFRLIYIDDASRDGSFEVAKDLIDQSGQAARITLIHNEQRLGSVGSLAHAAKLCQDNEIIVALPQNGFFAHEWALCRLNQYYDNPDLWLTCGECYEYPSYQPLSRGKTERGASFRASFAAVPPCSFYAALFKMIRENDLMDYGVFFPNDLAAILPMAEMAQNHFQNLPDPLSIVDSRAATDNEEKERAEILIRAKDPYAPLQSLFSAAAEEDGE